MKLNLVRMSVSQACANGRLPTRPSNWRNLTNPVTTLDVSKPETSNKPPALRPSPHNWRSGATNWCMRGGSVFQIIFNSGQALPLPGGRFSFPRIGRGGDTERLRNMYRSWPQTRPGHGHDPVQCRPRTQTVRVHEPSTAVNSPRPRSWPQTVRKHGLATDSIVPKPATVAVADCPQSGQSRGPSTTAN